jgi:hypothetical protein
MSLAPDENDEDEDHDDAVENVEATMVLREEIELMVQHVSQTIDCNNETLAILLRILRTMKN